MYSVFHNLLCFRCLTVLLSVPNAECFIVLYRSRVSKGLFFGTLCNLISTVVTIKTSDSIYDLLELSEGVQAHHIGLKLQTIKETR